MLNIRDLEKRWLRYKIKSYIPYGIIILTLLIIVSIIFIFTNIFSPKNKLKRAKKTPIVIKEKKVTIEDNRSKENNKTTITKTKDFEDNKSKIIQQIQEEPLLNEKKDNQQLLLQPSMDFLKNIQNQKEIVSYQHTTKKQKRVTVKNSVIKEKYFNQQKPTHTTKKSFSPSTTEESTPKSVITIKREDSQKDIDEIIKRFKENKNPTLSLFIAKKYYEMGNYEQSYNYALITNGIDNNLEDSWLIFAKSLVKLKKRDMAIKTLQEYINYSHSGNAKILLDDIKTGKFQ